MTTVYVGESADCQQAKKVIELLTRHCGAGGQIRAFTGKSGDLTWVARSGVSASRDIHGPTLEAVLQMALFHKTRKVVS